MSKVQRLVSPTDCRHTPKSQVETANIIQIMYDKDIVQAIW
jgi:hypothetical protein